MHAPHSYEPNTGFVAVLLRFVYFIISQVYGLFGKVEVQQPLVKQKLFGERIEVVMNRENETGLIPQFLKQCYDRIVENADEEGIFRIPGSAKEITEIVHLVDHGQTVDLKQFCASTVASLFKKFYRDLPEPLLTNELHSSWIELLTITDITERTNKIIVLFSKLPKHHQHLFITLFSLLNIISTEPHVTSSRMTVDNLSYIFGVNIMSQTSMETGKMIQVAKLCLLEYANIRRYYDSQ
jgi:hypothetical protein